MADSERKITIQPNGPYIVSGNVPLVRKSEVISEHGEPMWSVQRQTVLRWVS